MAGADDSYNSVGGPLSETRFRNSFSEQFDLLVDLARWIPVSGLVGVLAGTASALLLVSLSFATRVREAHLWLIWLLAPAGWLVGMMYKHVGSSVEAGNNLILEETHDPTATIPLRMTPLILIGTFMTHLFGGSAGREGTAIQTGASLADQLSRPLRMQPHDRRVLLMTGISAGFASVFGTPLAGAVFGLEVLSIGRLNYAAIAPCFMAAFAGDLVTRAWKVHHTVYPVSGVPAMSLKGVGCAMVAGMCFGLAGMVFAKLSHAISRTARRSIASGPMRPVAGGLLVTIAVFGIGTARTTKYIGLGIPTIVESFTGKVAPYDFAAKTVFTAVTLGTGFKGGEVTPLFYIGATLGNALSRALPLPSSLLAANTPIASTLMAVELFGAEAGAFAGIACVISYLFSGHAGIYQSQKVGKSKHVNMVSEEGLSLALVAKLRGDRDESRVEEISDFGFRGGDKVEEAGMLRLYFAASAMYGEISWGSKSVQQRLGGHLLGLAREQGIEQALLQRVAGGYLKQEDLATETAWLPQCLELVATADLLEAFLEHNKEPLRDVHVVFLRGREAEVAAETERQQIEVALGIERAERLLGRPDKGL
jgi:H+/Cl- antiporter ClcA